MDENIFYGAAIIIIYSKTGINSSAFTDFVFSPLISYNRDIYLNIYLTQSNFSNGILYTSIFFSSLIDLIKLKYNFNK